MVKLPGNPSKKRFALLAAGGGLALVIAAFLLVYFVLFPTSSPKPFKLVPSTAAAVSGTNAASSAASTASGAASTASGAAATTATPTAAGSATGGTARSWTIAAGSQAGYRVREKLAFLPAQSDAVGRTSSITGAATLRESNSAITITAASFKVAVNTLKSDRSMRDEKIHEIGLESDRYPTATFVLSTPLTLAKSAVTNRVARVSVTGVFTIHGVAKRETLPVEFTLTGATLEAAGALTFPWSEFGMTAPSVGGFVNVTGHATMEFDLRLTRA
jgi:polyisoprenoid-binding protein YceI